LICHLRSHSAWQRRIAAVDPETFRRLLTIDAGRPVRFEEVIEPWQCDDFRALDPAWLVLAGLEDAALHARAYLERPRGHSKTSDLAVQLTWLLAHALRPLHGLAAAADRDQANLIKAAMDRLGQLNPWVAERLKYQQHVVSNPATGSKLEIITSDVASSWGSLPDFVICDELCHWEKQEMWQSLFSAVAKRPHAVLVVLTNAGRGRQWHWDVREQARENEAWYFHSLDGPCAAWITEDALAEQRALLPPSVYARLWLNQWQETSGEFVTLAEAEACRDLALAEQSSGTPGWHYIAAIDYAEKHDYTVGVVLHWQGETLVVDRMDVVRPERDRPTPVGWVEDWMQQVAGAFGQVTFVLDEYMLVSVIQRLESRYAVHRFDFSAGRGNHALAANLRSLILGRRIRWYAGCGRIDAPWGRDDLETELASVVVRETAAGRWRIDHLPDAAHHDDRVFALGAAALYASENRGDLGWMQVTPPEQGGGFAW
jgi:hypothetical protein